MKILDLDMDFFMNVVSRESCSGRCSEGDYRRTIWTEEQVRDFLECNLGISKENKKRGRIVIGHNEALFYWKELIQNRKLELPFEVIHIDSHADLGLGYSSWKYILTELLQYPVDDRPMHNYYKDGNELKSEGIGDYLLFAIAYRWISKLTYCANPNGTKDDWVWYIFKDFAEKTVWKSPVQNVIQLIYNPSAEFPKYTDNQRIKKEFFMAGKKEPEVPFTVIPTIEAIKMKGDFDYVSMAQSPNYTPESADFIIDIFKEYIEVE